MASRTFGIGAFIFVVVIAVAGLLLFFRVLDKSSFFAILVFMVLLGALFVIVKLFKERNDALRQTTSQGVGEWRKVFEKVRAEVESMPGGVQIAWEGGSFNKFFTMLFPVGNGLQEVVCFLCRNATTNMDILVYYNLTTNKVAGFDGYPDEYKLINPWYGFNISKKVFVPEPLPEKRRRRRGGGTTIYVDSDSDYDEIGETAASYGKVIKDNYDGGE